MDDLLILPFDHRGSLLEKLFGIKGREPTPEEAQGVSDLKKIVYEGFERSLEMGVPKNTSGILVDEQFGTWILKDASSRGIITCCPNEKSGQDEFDFEYSDWREHIKRINPTYAKVLVRFNPGGDSGMNERQSKRLKELNDFLKQEKRKFLFELLVPATASQLESVGGNKGDYDLNLRPKLMVQAMKQLQDYGIEPDIWKVEGVERADDSRALVTQAQAGGRKAGIITLGRGENKEKVREWVKVGAKIPGVVGFAVGRTIFWDAIKGFKEKTLTRAQAVQMVADNYKEFVDLWTSEKGA